MSKRLFSWRCRRFSSGVLSCCPWQAKNKAFRSFSLMCRCSTSRNICVVRLDDCTRSLFSKVQFFSRVTGIFKVIACV